MMLAMSSTDTRQPEPERMGAARAVTVVCAAVSVLSAVALLVLVGGESASGAVGACAPGVRQVSGGLARAFCGPERERLRFRNGQCGRTSLQHVDRASDC
jgi:hypothetical protein